MAQSDPSPRDYVSDLSLRAGQIEIDGACTSNEPNWPLRGSSNRQQ